MKKLSVVLVLLFGGLGLAGSAFADLSQAPGNSAGKGNGKASICRNVKPEKGGEILSLVEPSKPGRGALCSGEKVGDVDMEPDLA